DPQYGGLGLDPRTVAMIVEELARGSAALAAIVVAHLALSWTIAQAGTLDQRQRMLPAMTRGEMLGAVAFASGVSATRDGVRATRIGDDWILEGETAAVDHAAHAGVVLVEASSSEGPVQLLVDPALSGVRVDPPLATLGLRGLGACRIHFDRCRVPSRDLLGGAVRAGQEPLALAPGGAPRIPA